MLKEPGATIIEAEKSTCEPPSVVGRGASEPVVSSPWHSGGVSMLLSTNSRGHMPCSGRHRRQQGDSRSRTVSHCASLIGPGPRILRDTAHPLVRPLPCDAQDLSHKSRSDSVIGSVHVSNQMPIGPRPFLPVAIVVDRILGHILSNYGNVEHLDIGSVVVLSCIA
ncbi:hypothetical protein LIA77_08315 [Sarocladium implicatum]|nr:hypothetical protein LIA77_08315 [Sarocladium implicatum]